MAPARRFHVCEWRVPIPRLLPFKQNRIVFRYRHEKLYGIWCVHSLKWSSPRIIAPPISPSVHLHQFTGYFKGVECTQKDSVILTTYTHQTESSHSLIGSPFLSKWVSMVKLRSWSWADWKFVTLRVGRPSALNTVTEYPDDGVILTSRFVTLIAIFQKSKA